MFAVTYLPAVIVRCRRAARGCGGGCVLSLPLVSDLVFCTLLCFPLRLSFPLRCSWWSGSLGIAPQAGCTPIR